MSEKGFVSLRNIVKRFGSNTVIDNFSLEIPKGQMLTLLGPSGCGKTTILRLVAGLEKPTSGQIFIDDVDVTDLSVQQRDICMVFQSYALFPHMSLGKNVGYGLRMMGLPRDEIRKKVDEALKLVDLEGFADRYVDQISGGQQQRVALARALVLQPKVLLFDEPLSNLDANLRRNMREKIRDLQKTFNITSLYVTHDQSEAFAVSDMVLVMNKGKIMQADEPHVLYRRPASRFMATFMGEANLFPATKSGDSVDCYGYKVSLGGGSQDMPDGKCTLGVRPEAIELTGEGTPAQKCRVEKVSYMGSAFEVVAGWNDETLLLELDSTGNEPKVGDEPYLNFQPRGVFVLPEA
ncbi:MAG: ferric ABC transporter ATP-binding protein [Methylobacteriaceae bacterium]|jgi:iron(III) transport system ATP-binding protein|nr:ferric ABC transporter ATP-binding protein [Methylobacteriaceae bacterium]